MPRSERDSLFYAIERAIEDILGCLDALRGNEIDRRIPETSGNSLLVIATHVMGNAEQNIIELLGGTPVGRVRAAEFEVAGQASDPVRAHWNDLRARLRAAVEALPESTLDVEFDHPNRGRITGRDVMLVVVRHANEHLGEAQLIKDLIVAERGAA